MSESTPYRVRAMVAGDMNYIRSSWMRSSCSSKLARAMGVEHYRRDVRGLVEMLLTRASVLVACSDQDDATLLGWLAYERPAIVHYAYVREELRRNGVATAMLAAAGLQDGLVATFWTDCVRDLPVKWRYSPFGWLS